MPRPLYVTRPLLPDLNDLRPFLEKIWETKILTNGGPFHEKLERELANFLDVPSAMLFNNGTIALLVTLKMMNLPIGSEVITTPLTFAASAHSVTWNSLNAVFVDVDPETLTIDPASVEKAITSKTSAILAVHVYGNICDVHALQQYCRQTRTAADLRCCARVWCHTLQLVDREIWRRVNIFVSCHEALQYFRRRIDRHEQVGR